MPRSSREKDDRRSSPSRDRSSRHHKHRDHRKDDEQYKRKEFNRHGDKYQRGSAHKHVREYEGRRKYEDHSDTRNNRSGRRYKYDGNGEKRQRRRSPSPSGDASRKQGVDQPNSAGGKSRRTSGFDVAPPATTSLSDQFAMMPHMLSSGISQVNLGSASLFPVPSSSQQATRHARRVYVGGLPPLTNEHTISKFFNHVMALVGGNSAGPGDAVINVYINHDKKFAFVEMRTVEEASNAMALDGVVFEGVSVRIRRPTDYNPSLAAVLGPSKPSPHLNLAAAGITPGLASVAEGADRIFVGGVPYYFTEPQIKDLLETFGSLLGFELVKDRDTGISKGYGFCVYKDPSVTDMVCASLNGMKVGDKTLTVRRATISGQTRSGQEHILAQAQHHIEMQKMAIGAAINLHGEHVASAKNMEIPTKILCLSEAVTIVELMDDEQYEEILEDMREECQKFGELISVVIPRPDPDVALTDIVGKVFLEYSDTAGCAKAKSALTGRKFGGNTVTTRYYPEDKYYEGIYTA